MTDDDVAAQVAAIGAAADLRGQQEAAARAAAAGEGDRLADLAVALAGEVDTAPHGGLGAPWQYRSALRSVLTALALTPVAGNAEAVARFVARTVRPDLPDAARPIQSRLRWLASMLASGRPTGALVPLLDPDASAGGLDLAACLAQELVLRRVDLAADTTANRLVAVLGEAGHPLAWLPLRLLELETGFSLPRYSLSATSTSVPFGPEPAASGRAAPPAGGPPPAFGRDAVRETTDPAEAERIAAAVANWVAESNGMTEARVFELPATDPAAFGAGLLALLPVDALAGATPDGITATSTAAGGVLSPLFSAASSGGAYNSGLAGAHGRLQAWRSLAGLAGAAPGDPIDRVAGRAASCHWLFFYAAAPWFAQVTWDLGVAALRPGGTTLAFLAATDTD